MLEKAMSVGPGGGVGVAKKKGGMDDVLNWRGI